MTDSKKTTKPDSKKGTRKAKNTTKKCPVDKYKIVKIKLSVEAPDNKVFMNDPDDKVLVKAIVSYKKSGSGHPWSTIVSKVNFKFSDSGNTTKADSYNYSGSLHLGKKSDASAIHWDAHSDHGASSSDGFKKYAKSSLKEVEKYKTAETKIYFKPSGVGGDSFDITANALNPDGTTVAATDKSDKFVIWRKVHFSDVYTMASETYIEDGSAVANVNPAFNAKAFVKYTRAAVNNLANTLTVRYLGLYKSGGGSKNWPEDFSPEKLESSPNQLEPTTEELADYNGTDAAKKAVAKGKIEAKAQLWFNAIVSDYVQSSNDWFADAAIDSTKNSLLAIQYYHPKLSRQNDPVTGDPEGKTEFWPAGISINLANPGSGLNTPGDPDQDTWRGVQGFNKGKIVVIFKNYGSDPRLQIICRHEVGHATKSAFEREIFGTGDHSASALMTPYGGSNKFSTADIKKLRGIK